MALDKALMLKGLAGVAALGTVTVVGVGASGLMGESGETKKDEINKRLDSLGLDGCHIEDLELSPTPTFSKECDLTLEQFKKIHFSNWEEGIDELRVDGWTDSSTIKLAISGLEGNDEEIKFLFKNHPTSLTITKSEADQSEKITIRANKDTEFEATEDNKLDKKYNRLITQDLKKHNQKLESFKLPESCRFDETEEDNHIDCSLSDGDLKKINFSNRGEIDPTIDGYEETNKVTLKVERVKGNNSESLKYLFRNNNPTNTLTISNQSEKITLRSQRETEFEEEGGKLKKKSDESTKDKLQKHNTKLESLKLPENCKFDVTEDDSSRECLLSEEDLRKIEFSNRGNSDPTIGGHEAGKIALKIERMKTQDPETLKYTFKNSGSTNLTITSTGETKTKITLRANTEREFEENNNKLSKKAQDSEISTKLNNYNIEKLQPLSLPESCTFDDTETDTTLTCDITSSDLPKIKFSIKENGDLTLEEGQDFSGLKLEIKEKQNNDLSFAFKNVNKKIKLSGENSKSVYLKKGEGNEFEFKDSALHKIPKEVNRVASKVNLTCTYGDAGNSGSCTVSGTFLNVSETENGVAKVQSIHFGGKDETQSDKATFTFTEDQSSYENKIKFTFTGENIEGKGGSEYKGKLEKEKSYEVKNVSGIDCLSKREE